MARNLARVPLSESELAGFDLAVLDPPRQGAPAQAAAFAAALDTGPNNARTHRLPATLIYVSCNPASFARDTKTLATAGYRLQRVVPIDQFVYTHHLELVGLLRLTPQD